MTLPRCRLQMPDGEILEGSICGYVSTGNGRCVLFWHSRDVWGIYPVNRIIPEQLTLFE